MAWSQLTATVLTPGEVLAVRHLSAVYVDQYHKSERPECTAPHIGELPARDAVADKMKTLFAMLRS